MPERLLLARDNELFHADAATNGGVESGSIDTPAMRMRVCSKAIAPAGPTGECVFRRAYVTVSVDGGYSVRVTPLIDGQQLPECAMVFADRLSTPTGTAKTHVLEVPLFDFDPERNISRGVRGTSLEVLVETEPIVIENDDDVVTCLAMFGTVHVETVSVMYHRGSAGL